MNCVARIIIIDIGFSSGIKGHFSVEFNRIIWKFVQISDLKQIYGNFLIRSKSFVENWTKFKENLVKKISENRFKWVNIIIYDRKRQIKFLKIMKINRKTIKNMHKKNP